MKKILSFIMVLCMLVSVLCVSASDNKIGAAYDDSVLRKLLSDYITNVRTDMKLFESTYDEVTFDVVYSHSSSDEATPDYVLVDVNFMTNGNEYMSIQIGDYIITNDAWYRYYPAGVLGYFVVLPETGEVLNLEKAFSRPVEGIDAVLAQSKVARRIGDAQGDGKLDIKDATYIQKILAGFEGFENEYYCLINRVTRYYYGDFDGNCKLNIKDVTNLQKYLAGLPYNYRYSSETRFGSTPDSASTVDFAEQNFNLFGFDGGKEHNKLITSASEYESFFQAKSDVYNEEFFSEKSIVYIYRWYSSGSYSFHVRGVYAQGDTLYVDCYESYPPPDSFVTNDIGVYEKFVVVEKEKTGEVSKLIIDQGIITRDYIA